MPERSISAWGLALTLLLGGCSNLPLPFDPRMFDSLGYQIAELFDSEEKEIIDKAELEALNALDEIPLLWKTRIGDSDMASFHVAFENDAVYVADEDGQLTRLDPQTGEKIWEVKTKNPFSAGVGAGEGMVLVGSSKGEVFAFNESGHTLWKSQVSSEILSPPQIKENMVVVRTTDGRVNGLDALDGKRKWFFQGATPALTVRSSAGVAITQGAVFAGFAGGKLVGMSLFTGNVGWEAVVSQPRGVTELERMTDITSSPAIDDRLICAVAYQGRVACFQIIDGTQIWARESSSSEGLTMDSDYVYVSEEKGVLAAYDKRSGAGMWKQVKLGSKNLTAPIVTSQYVVIGDDKGYVNILRNYDGVVLARAATDGSAILSRPQRIPEGFVVQTAEGGVFAFSTQF
ncbi:outer membrane protein assembly factor BamB [Nitrosomonas marina]|uniref:Outer membrane protein assembly factor BamB n=1 Tax=Nitrosomonas marina TaxID=917 RepID=A0A1H8FIV1_9PROT|nr:outer membrane protein assembly factor BamB [Nitrosomonas marina]SEN31444.1 Beta-barrel assembly machine subunit BamB [Nitrosomonas marina]